MLEFYFDDSNFSWDRFMQSKVSNEQTFACCSLVAPDFAYRAPVDSLFVAVRVLFGVVPLFVSSPGYALRRFECMLNVHFYQCAVVVIGLRELGVLLSKHKTCNQGLRYHGTTIVCLVSFSSRGARPILPATYRSCVLRP